MQFTGHMVRGSGARRSHVELARMGLGVGNEFRKRLSRKGWIHFNDPGATHDGGNRGNIANEIEIEFFVERRVDSIRDADQEQRVSIRGRLDDGFGADIRAGTWPVFDDELLPKVLR